nr:hypothetical protein [Tanacetum cinerariifolium]
MKTKRKDTELPQTSVPTKVILDKAVYEEMYDSVERNATIATGLDAKQDRETMGDAAAQTRSKRVSKFSNDPLLSRVTLGSREDRLQLRELMKLCTKLSNRFLDLEKTKTAQANEIAKLKKRVKRLERKKKSRSHGLKRLYKGRIADINADDNITLVNDQEMFDADRDLQVIENISTARIEETVSTAAPITTVDVIPDELTMAQALVEIKKSKPKGATTTTTVTIPTPDSIRPKARGVVMQKPNQISFDEQEAKRLQAKFNEQDKLAKEKAQLIKDETFAWDNVQAMMDADYELAARLTEKEQGELTTKEKSRLFVELMDKRKKYFAKLRAEEKKTTNQSSKEESNVCLSEKHGWIHSQSVKEQKL